MKLIQDLAREVGAVEGVVLFGRHDNTVFTPGELLTFAALVIEQEHKRLLEGSEEPIVLTESNDGTPTAYTADQIAAAVLRERERCVVEVDKVRGKNQITEAIRGLSHHNIETDPAKIRAVFEEDDFQAGAV